MDTPPFITLDDAVLDEAYETAKAFGAAHDLADLHEVWHKDGHVAWESVLCFLWAYRQQVGYLKTQLPRWIPVAERLPEKFGGVRVWGMVPYSDRGCELHATFLPEEGFFNINPAILQHELFRDLVITHWQPIVGPEETATP